MKNDIKIFYDEKSFVKPKVQINFGAQFSFNFKSEEYPQEFSIYRPKRQWRDLTPIENKQFFTKKMRPLSFGVYIFNFPEKIIERFNQLDLERYANGALAYDQMGIENKKIFKNEVLRYLLQSHFSEFDPCKIAISSVSPGQETTIIDVKTNTPKGLHIDSWQKPLTSPLDRDTYGGRVCFNMGQEDRELVLVPKSVGLMMKELRKKDSKYWDKYLNEKKLFRFVDDYLTVFQDAPILKITIKKGQAYILPVQNCIHDGRTVNKEIQDLAYQFSAQSWRLKQAKRSIIRVFSANKRDLKIMNV